MEEFDGGGWDDDDEFEDDPLAKHLPRNPDGSPKPFMTFRYKNEEELLRFMDKIRSEVQKGIDKKQAEEYAEANPSAWLDGFWGAVEGQNGYVNWASADEE